MSVAALEVLTFIRTLQIEQAERALDLARRAQSHGRELRRAMRRGAALDLDALDGAAFALDREIADAAERIGAARQQLGLPPVGAVQ